MKSILKNISRKNKENTKLHDTKNTKEEIVVNITSANILVCIINNPGIDALKIVKKTKIPQASVYRALFSLIEAGFLDTMQRKPGPNGGNSTIMYASKTKRLRIIIDSKGTHVY